MPQCMIGASHAIASQTNRGIAVPTEIAFPGRLPKTRSGKIMRRLLKAQELGKDVGDISTLEERGEQGIDRRGNST